MGLAGTLTFFLRMYISLRIWLLFLGSLIVNINGLDQSEIPNPPQDILDKLPPEIRARYETAKVPQLKKKMSRKLRVMLNVEFAK